MNTYLSFGYPLVKSREAPQFRIYESLSNDVDISNIIIQYLAHESFLYIYIFIYLYIQRLRIWIFELLARIAVFKRACQLRYMLRNGKSEHVSVVVAK